jgi:hypothetical protein
MKTSTLLSAFVGALFAASFTIAPAHAQATRTWISGVGDDANPCSRTAPCKTWAGAISKTAVGGEIDALDPGGFGALTITKSITLDGGGGQVASTLVAGTNAMTITGAGLVVILRNIRFNGLLNTSPSSNSPTGINILNASRVIIQKCDIFGFSTAGIGVNMNTAGTVNVAIEDTTSNNNTVGILVSPTVGGVTSNVTINHSYSDNNVGGGLKVTGVAGDTANVAVNDSSMSVNGGNGVNSVSNGGTTNVDIKTSLIGENAGSGVQSSQSGGGTSAVTVGDTILSFNVGGAWSIVSSGALSSYKNNQVTGPMGSTPATATFQ